MTTTAILLDAVLLAAVFAAAAWDVRTRRIPNWLTVSAFALALLLRLPMGLGAVLDGLGAAGIALAICIPVFALGGLGGGDVKLLTAVGAFLGIERLWGALLVTFLVGGLFALVAVIRRRRGGETTANMYMIFRSLRTKGAYTGWKGPEGDAVLTIRSAGAIAQPYAIAIAIGATYGVFPLF
jgi:prepilin peptidase CpaA